MAAVTAPAAPSPDRTPDRAPTARRITLPLATGLVIGTMIGSGIFTLPASLAKFGPVSLVAFAVTAFGSIMLALAFASLARRIPETGGPYAFARTGFGDFMGFETAWNYWIGLWVSVGAIAVSFTGYLGELVPAVGESRTWQVVAAVGAITLLTLLNALGTAVGGVVTTVLTVLKVVPLVILVAVGLFRIDWANFGPFVTADYSFFGAVLAALPLTLFAFIGFESATVPAGDVENPEKTIPRATILGSVSVAALYLLVTFVVFGTVPNAELQESAAPLADSATSVMGVGGTFMSLAAVVSTLGAMTGLILIQAQVPLAAGRDHLFPSVFARTSPRGVPLVGIVVSSLLAVVVTVANFSGGGGLVEVYEKIVLLSTVATLVPYAFSAGAEMVWVATTRTAVPRARLARNFVVALLGFGYAVVAIIGAGSESVYLWVPLFLLGVIAYVWVLHRPAATP
jgi:APA family basic amino acid/polyamine antiporter